MAKKEKVREFMEEPCEAMDRFWELTEMEYMTPMICDN